MMQITYPKLNGTIEIYMDCLEALCGEERGSMIDLGCNLAPNTPRLKFNERTYIDALYRELDHKEEQPYFKQCDILNMYWHYVYNTSFALDVIEHMTYSNGEKLLSLMWLCSNKQILFTPLTDLFGMDYETDNPESHRSLWTPEMIEEKYPNKYAFLIFPNYHQVWNGGAFFFWACEHIKQDFERVSNILKQKTWA